MTDVNKALAFAKECLKWPNPSIHATHKRTVISETSREENTLDTAHIQPQLEAFLGNRFFIQINRGTTNLFKWSVIVGPQNLLGAPPNFDNGRGDSDDLFDAIFDACVQAARMFPNAAGSGAP
jgi:hypothetical protein